MTTLLELHVVCGEQTFSATSQPQTSGSRHHDVDAVVWNDINQNSRWLTRTRQTFMGTTSSSMKYVAKIFVHTSTVGSSGLHDTFMGPPPDCLSCHLRSNTALENCGGVDSALVNRDSCHIGECFSQLAHVLACSLVGSLSFSPREQRAKHTHPSQVSS